MRNATVLVVQQAHRSARALERTLAALGYEVCAVAGAAAEAAVKADALRPDLVLMDPALVREEGIDHAQRVRSTGALLILTARAPRGYVLEPAQADLADGYLVLPCRAPHLHAVLQIALSQRQRAAAHDADADRLRRLTDSVPVLLGHLSRDGRYQFANRLHEKWFGIARERIAGRSLTEVLGPQWCEALAQPLAQALAGQAVALEHESPDPAGRHVQMALVPDRTTGGVGGVFFAGTNITARIAAQRAAAQELDQLRAVLDALGEAVIAVDASECVQYMNPAAEALTQWTAAEVCGVPIGEVLRFVESDSGRPIDSPSREVLATGASAHLPAGAALLSRDGQEYTVEDVCTSMRDARGAATGAVLLMRYAAAHPAATAPGAHDALTGLMNRREFERVIERHLRSARESHQQHALLYIDVDQLHEINETCGHHAGDELLRRVAAALLARLRRSDLLARVGGDDFAVFMPNCPLHRARQIAQALVDGVRHTGFAWQGRACSVGLSIGAAATGQVGCDAGALLAAGEVAATLAKDAGGDRVHVYQADGAGTPPRSGESDWAARIASGLAGGRFHLFAQRVVPIGDTAGPAQCCYEILLRLEGHNGALLPPMAFLPAAERCRLMAQVDRWVIAHSLDSLAAHLREAGREGGGPSYSLNLSGASVADEALLDFIVAEIERTGVPAQRLCFEVAEATALGHLHQTGLLAKGLKQLGCRFALDHFHSGVGAYAYLQDLPVDYLKIDGSFVKGMLSDQLDGAVVEGISRIGQALGIATVGECAESAAILARLQQLGIGHAQGYLIHRPEPLQAALAAPAPPCAGGDWAVEWYQG